MTSIQKHQAEGSGSNIDSVIEENVNAILDCIKN